MAPSRDLGDTVDAKYFEPKVIKKKPVAQVDSLAKDSIDIFYIGDGSTKANLQLVSYPSRRDTFLYSKAKHIEVNGSADFGHVMRATFYQLKSGDSIVARLDEIKLAETAQGNSDK